ncbi:hypothetical protein FACS1894106_3570 [Spirochaetia bacterium]|nr:hypothetical protein FACS1894106_3570 [Spirochaetia bacterium]
MKKNVVLWLLPLAAALFISFPFDLSALSSRDQQELTRLEAKQASGKKLTNSENRKLLALTTQRDQEVEAVAPSLTPPNEPGSPGEPASPSVSQTGNTAGSGDAKKPENPPTPEEPKYEVPKWITDLALLRNELSKEQNIDLDKVYIGIGSGRNKSDPLQAIRMAEARARQDIGFQYTTLVGATITDVWQNTGGKAVTEDQIVGKQSIDLELFPVTVVKRDEYPEGSGDWWVVVTAPKTAKPGAVGETATDVETAMEKAVRMMEESLARDRSKRSR